MISTVAKLKKGLCTCAHQCCVLGFIPHLTLNKLAEVFHDAAPTLIDFNLL